MLLSDAAAWLKNGSCEDDDPPKRKIPHFAFRNRSAPPQADHGGAEFAGEVELQRFAIEGR